MTKNWRIKSTVCIVLVITNRDFFFRGTQYVFVTEVKKRNKMKKIKHELPISQLRFSSYHHNSVLSSISSLQQSISSNSFSCMNSLRCSAEFSFINLQIFFPNRRRGCFSLGYIVTLVYMYFRLTRYTFYSLLIHSLCCAFTSDLTFTCHGLD